MLALYWPSVAILATWFSAQLPKHNTCSVPETRSKNYQSMERALGEPTRSSVEHSVSALHWDWNPHFKKCNTTRKHFKASAPLPTSMIDFTFFKRYKSDTKIELWYTCNLPLFYSVTSPLRTHQKYLRFSPHLKIWLNTRKRIYIMPLKKFQTDCFFKSPGVRVIVCKLQP